MRADKQIKLAVVHEGFVWRAQAARTASGYDDALADLRHANTSAATYLGAIPAANWALYPHYDSTPLYGWRTTNFVESEQARALKLKPRLMLPYEFFRAYANIMMSEAYIRQKQWTQWTSSGLTITPRAETKFQNELKRMPQYTATFSSPDIVFVARVGQLLTQRRVNISKPHCTCTAWAQNHVVCRHILTGLQASVGLGNALEMMGTCYKVDEFSTPQDALNIPTDDELTNDESLLPARFHRQAGRPRKWRIRSRGENEGVHGARKLYRCSVCGVADGHNKATCRALV